MFVNRERSSVQTVLVVLLVASLGLNAYLLFFQRGEAEPAGASPPSGGVTISDAAPPAGTGAEATGAPVESASAAAATDSTGTTLDAASGTKLLKLPVEGSLAQTFATALGSETGDIMSAVFSRIFVWKLDLRTDVYKGDEIRLVYRLLPELNDVEILAATYLSRKHRQTFQAFRFTPADKKFASYYDENGVEIPVRFEKPPLDEYDQITALLRDRRRHNGMDFKTPVGTKVFAPFKGRVVRLNWNAPNGTCIELEYGDGVRAKFLHLNRILSGISPGRTVQAGEHIADSGNTGHSTAPHLHYELDRKGKILDPLEYHKTFNATLPESQRAEFEAVRQKVTTQLGD